jgi:hypothetical protein
VNAPYDCATWEQGLAAQSSQVRKFGRWLVDHADDAGRFYMAKNYMRQGCRDVGLTSRVADEAMLRLRQIGMVRQIAGPDRIARTATRWELSMTATPAVTSYANAGRHDDATA